jgi:ankyrin repeat protein
MGAVESCRIGDFCHAETVGNKALPKPDEFWHDKMQVSRASQELFNAAATRDLEKAVRAIQGMGDPDACNARGLRPLQMAVANGHLAMVQLLVERAADVNATGEKTVPPVVLAVGSGDVEMLSCICKARADLHVSTPSTGETAWTRAAELGHLEILRLAMDHAGRASTLLLQRGRRTDGNTPLHCAAEKGHLDFVDFLLTVGADPCPVNNEGATPSLLAAEYGHMRIVQLLGPAHINKPDRQGRTPLIAATKLGNTQLVWEILRLEAEVDHQDRGGMSAMMIASGEGSVSCLRHLIAFRGSPHLEDSQGRTAFAHALQTAQSQCLGLLLAAGADEPAVQNPGWRPPYTDLSAAEYERVVQARK